MPLDLSVPLVPAVSGLGSLPEIVVATLAFGMVAVLPGFGFTAVLRRLEGRRDSGGRGARRTATAANGRSAGTQAHGGDQPRAGVTELVLGLAWSSIVISAAGALLLAVGWFSAERIAIFAVGASAVGVPSFLRWLQNLAPRRFTVLMLGLLTLPWVYLATRAGSPPASSYQWYYWNLGSQLDSAGGIPSSVTEFGEAVRWLPDYVFFNVFSEAYGALTPGFGDVSAVAYWRVPASLLGLLATYLVLRLWLGRSSALVGVAAVSATTFFVLKFNAYKPEPVAISLGLLAVWLTVRGVRDRSPSWVLLAGALAGLAVGVHAIGATAIALLVLAAACVEWLWVPRRLKLRMAIVLVLGGVAAGGVLLATGASLQGRAVVVSEASRPAVVDGVDPTYTFFRRTAGRFDAGVQRSRSSRVRSAIDQPWPGVDLNRNLGRLAVLVIVAGLGLALLLGAGRQRRAVLVVGVFTALLAGAMAVFAIAFDTYVPQHTGIARFGSYVPFAAGLAVGPALEGFLLGWARLRAFGGTQSRGTRAPALGRVGAVALPALAVAWALYTVAAPLGGRERVNLGDVGPEFRELDQRLTGAGARALATLREEENRGAVMTNASTRGTVEFMTGLETPLEGRQPFIEDGAFLGRVNDLLLAANEYFQDPTDAAILGRLGIGWVLVADRPGLLGAGNFYREERSPFARLLGRTLLIERLARQPGLELVSREDGVALFGVRDAPGPVDQLGAVDRRMAELALAALALAALMGALAAASRLIVPARG